MLIRYERGNGLSDWDVDDIAFEAFVRDLETVVDAAGLERFALLGISQGCAASVAYAVRHPERATPAPGLGRGGLMIVVVRGRLRAQRSDHHVRPCLQQLGQSSSE